MKGSVGRPRTADAARLADRIVAAATEHFLRDGYAATTVEAIAATAGVAKRTFYARFPDKPAIFLAVTRRLIQDWLVGFDHAIDQAQTLPDALLAIASKTLDVALTPTGLALHMLLTAEARRFPELPQALRASGADIGANRVAALLQRNDPALPPEAATRAAGLFQGMVIHTPQARAVAGAPPMDAAARTAWCRAAVDMLLNGVTAR